MTSNFQSWVKDPLFFAAEQVQDAADRLESAYRAWIHAKSLPSNAQDSSVLDFCKRELSTALGIAKGQLEEFEKEASILTTETQQQRTEDDASQRHRQFIVAISNQLSSIKNALLFSKDERDLNVLPAVRLCREESDQLAHFLCGSRLNTSEDAKDMLGSCPTSGKGCKEMVPSCQSGTSMSSSGAEGGNVLFGSLDECSSSPDTHISMDAQELGTSKGGVANRLKVFWPTGKTRGFVCINGNRRDIAPTFSASNLLMNDCYSSGGKCIERSNGHRRSTSLGGDLSYCTERENGNLGTVIADTGMGCSRDGLSVSEYKVLPNPATGTALVNLWSFVSKVNFLFRVGGASSNGLKRWKDGECEGMDPCEFLRSDLEQGCGIFSCQDGGWSEMQTSHRFSKGFYARRLIQATSATLAIVGLVGLYLH